MVRRIAVLTGKACAGKTTLAKYLVHQTGFERVRFAGPLKRMAKEFGLNDDQVDGHLKEEPTAWLSKTGLGACGWLLQSCAMKAIDAAVGVMPENENDPRLIPQFGDKTLGYALGALCEVVVECIRQGGEQGASSRLLQQMLGTEWGRDRMSKKIWTDMWRADVEKLAPHLNVCVDDCRFPNEIDAAASMGDAVIFRIMRSGAGVKAQEQAAQTHESEKHMLGYHFEIKNNGQIEDAGSRVFHLFDGSFLPPMSYS